jgi:hypothetical protein
MITIWIDDYIVVMVYVNQYCLDTFACVRIRCKPYHINQQNLAN